MNPRLTRRNFLRSTLATGALAALQGPLAEASSSQADAAAQIGTLVDLTRCIGCRACMRACNDRNNLPKLTNLNTAWEGDPVPLTYKQWTTVNPAPAMEGFDPLAVKRQCMHCLDPACASVCPVGALHQIESGAVIYRADRCVGCRYCVLACPFQVPKFQWDSGITPVIGKCQFCAQTADPRGPSCAAACPTGAIKFGKREALLTEARYRIRIHPEKYVPHIYGEHEVGGTAWLYISDRPFDKIGFPDNLPAVPLPSLTRVAMHILPGVVAVLMVVLGSISFVIRKFRGTKESHSHA